MQPRSWFYRQLAKQAEFSQYLSNAYSRVDWWYMQDQPPSTVLAHVGPALALGRELLSAAGDGTADKDNWTSLNDAVLTNPSANLMRIARDGTNNPGAFQTATVAGKSYLIVGEARSDGNAVPRVLTKNAGTIAWTGVKTHTNWQPFSVAVDETAAIVTLNTVTLVDTEYTEWRILSCKQTGILASSAYTLGNDPMEGANTSITMGQLAGYNLEYAGLFDGINDYGNISSAEINSKLNPDELTLLAFGTSSTWAAGVDYLANLKVDANNSVSLSRSATNLIASYKAGGTDESITVASGSPSGFFMFAITVDVAGDAVKAYYNGVKSGATQTIAGTWVGNLAATTTLIGALITTPTNSWSGLENYFGLAPYAMTALEIADIWQKSGLA